MKHGNKLDPQKTVRVWYAFSDIEARLIVEDQGEGFQNIEEWNQFNAKRQELFESNKFEEMADYVSFQTKTSDEYDGGNSLFAAVEYWNRGVVYNASRNGVAVGKSFLAPEKK